MRIVVRTLPTFETTFPDRWEARSSATRRRAAYRDAIAHNAVWYAAMGLDMAFERSFTDILSCASSGDEWAHDWDALVTFHHRRIRSHKQEVFDRVAARMCRMPRRTPHKPLDEADLDDPDVLEHLLALRDIHDNADHWDRKGLNSRGREALRDLAELEQFGHPAFLDFVFPAPRSRKGRAQA